MKSDIDLRTNLAENIVLSGGTTMYTGIKERLIKRMKALAPSNMKITVKA